MAIGNAIGIGVPMVNLGLGGGGAPVSFLLDDYPNTSTGTVNPSAIQGVSYSLRNLFSTYTGNVVTVRRSSDDAELSFTASEVGDGTMVSWVNAAGSGKGFVKIWHDQNGNYDLTQSTASQQPMIVSTTGLITVNGKAAIDFTQAGLEPAKALNNSSLYPSPLTEPELYNMFAVNELGAQGTDVRVVYNLSSLGNNTFSIANATVTLEGKAANTSTSISPTYVGNQTLYQTTSGRNGAIGANKNVLKTGNISNTFVTQFSLGLALPAAPGDNSPNMKVQEFVFYPFARFPRNTFTADEVSDAINSYYSIF